MARGRLNVVGVPRVPRGFVPAAGTEILTDPPGPVTVFRAPRGWGKTTTAAAWLRSLAGEYEFCWLSLSVPTDTVAFGRLLEEQFERVGVEGPWRDLAQLAPQLSQLGRRLVLVIDNAQLLTSTDVDELLMDAAVRNDLLHVVFIGRQERTIELLARIETDCAVLGVSELRLGETDVQQIAGVLGQEITAAEAARTVHQVGGWPALVRSYWIAGPGELLQQEAIEHYLQIVLDDEPPDPVFTLAMRSSPVPELDDEVVRLLDLGASAHEVLWPLRRAGLVTGERLSELVRLALARLYARVDPDGCRTAHERLADWFDRAGQETTALTHALEAGRPARVRALLRRNWLSIADHPELVRTAMRVVERESAEDVRLLILRQQVGLEVDAIDRAPLLDDELPEALTTWGLARIHTMDLNSGENALREALQHAERLGSVAAEQRARAALAYARAVVGAVAEAQSLLRSCQDEAETAQLRQVTREIIAFDTLAWDSTAPQALDPAALDSADGSTAVSGDVLLTASVALARELGSSPVPARYRAALEAQLQALGPEPAHELARTCVIAALMSAWLAEGKTTDARLLPVQTLRHEQARHWLTVRAGFYAGDFTGVLARTDPSVLIDTSSSPPRVILEMLLLRACALIRTYRASEAADAFHAAVSLAQTHGLVRPLVLLPRSDLRTIAAMTPHLQEFLEQLPPAGYAGHFRLPAVQEGLSESELRVLRAMSDGAPVSLVASRLFVSMNTIKSQLRSIYRKLGVHNRDEALRRTRELGLLGHTAGDSGPDVADSSRPAPREPLL